MRILGVICELNPFHNGHQFLIETLRKQTGADAVVCAMSGSFVQRGAPACVNKWTRAEMALRGGADLVLELPVCSAVQSAERFALGGVTLLSALGLEGYLGFGSEAGELAPLAHAAQLLEQPLIREQISAAMKSGMSYPAAQAEVLSQDMDEWILTEPNNTLGIEYLRALSSAGSPLLPVTLKRRAAAHDSQEPKGAFASATFLRGLPERNNAAPYIPPEAFPVFEKAPPVRLEPLDAMLFYRLRSLSRRTLLEIADVTEGLENRILNAAAECGAFSILREAVKSKRYTMTRVDRVLMQTLIGITKELSVPPQYVRVLGMTHAGSAVLREMKNKCRLPVIVKTADAALSTIARRQLERDVFATDLISLLDGTNRAGRDFWQSPILYNAPKGGSPNEA